MRCLTFRYILSQRNFEIEWHIEWKFQESTFSHIIPIRRWRTAEIEPNLWWSTSGRSLVCFLQLSSSRNPEERQELSLRTLALVEYERGWDLHRNPNWSLETLRSNCRVRVLCRGSLESSDTSDWFEQCCRRFEQECRERQRPRCLGFLFSWILVSWLQMHSQELDCRQVECFSPYILYGHAVGHLPVV